MNIPDKRVAINIARSMSRIEGKKMIEREKEKEREGEMNRKVPGEWKTGR